MSAKSCQEHLAIFLYPCHAERVKDQPFMLHVVKHYTRFFCFIFIGIGLFFTVPLIVSPTYAKMVEECRDLSFGKYYCHCDGNKIVCPNDSPWTTACTPYLTKQTCKDTEKCVDSGLPEEKNLAPNDRTPKNAKCVTKPAARTECKCDNPGNVDVGKNGFTCTLADGNTRRDFCALNQYCEGAGECKPMDCTCDGDDKMVCSRTGARGTGRTIECGDNLVCDGDPGKAACVSKLKKQYGHCRCAGDKNIVCDRGKHPGCFGVEKCVTDSNAELGIRCQDDLGPTLPPVPPPPCAPGKTNNGVCTAFMTAFGEINTDASSFLLKLFALLLAVSGGLAVLLIMRAGYTIMTSAGNGEQVKKGREQLIAAIVGLLFIIFSLVILEVIGVQILRLPDFIGAGGNNIPELGTCNVNNSKCATGLVCQYNNGTGQCVKAQTGTPCDPNKGSTQCPAGQSCVYNGTSGQCQ